MQKSHFSKQLLIELKLPVIIGFDFKEAIKYRALKPSEGKVKRKNILHFIKSYKSYGKPRSGFVFEADPTYAFYYVFRNW